MMVKKVGSNPTWYRVEMVNKAGVPPYKPRLPLIELEKNTVSRDILLTKRNDFTLLDLLYLLSN